VRNIKNEFKETLFLLERPGNRDWNRLYQRFKWALEHGYEFIFEMDADFSHDPTTLSALMMPVRMEPTFPSAPDINPVLMS